MLRFCFVILILTYSFFSYSQSKIYKPGWYVTQENDTIRGEFLYLDWDVSPQYLTFKKDDVERTIHPSDVKNVVIGLQIFRSYVGPVVYTSFSARDLKAAAKIEYVTDSVFLSYLVTSDISLLTYKDRNEKLHFFVEDQTNELSELTKYEYIYSNDDINGLLIQSVDRYKGQLVVLENSCQKLQLMLRDMEFSEKDMTKAFKYILGCKGTYMQYEKKESNTKKNIYLLGGATFLHYSINSELFPRLDRLDYSGNIAPKFGIGLELQLPRTNNKFSVILELTKLKHEYQGFENVNTPSFSEEYTFHINSDYIKVNTLVRRSISYSKKSRLFFDFGFVLNLGEVSSYENIVRFDLSGTQTYDNDNSFLEPIGFTPTFAGGIGYEFERLAVISRFEYGLNGFTSSFSVGSKSSSVDLLLAYSLFRK